MYPVLFRIGSFEVTSFGVMVAIAALVGLWIFRRELRRSGLPESASDAAVWGLFAGLIGAKLLWVAEHAGEAPFVDLLLARGGLSWYGGFIGGVGTGFVVIGWQRWPIGTPPSHVDRLLVRLASLGYQQACVIGEVASPAGSRRRLRIV